MGSGFSRAGGNCARRRRRELQKYIQYAGIRHQVVTAGRLIGELDMMIAAHALALGAVLVTNNTRHFEQIEAPLLLANWRANP